MTCRGVRKRISLYIDGRLPEDARAQVGRHLDSCAACRSLLAETESALETLKLLKREAPPAGGWERLRERLLEQSGPSRVRRALPAWWWKPLPAAAAAGIVVLSALLVWRGPSGEDLAVSRPTVPPAVRGELRAPEPAPQPGRTEVAVAVPLQPVAAPPAVTGPRPARTAAPVRIRASGSPPARPAVPADNLPAPPEPAPGVAVASLEPDPESPLALAANPDDVLDEPAAELALTGLSPLVAAAEQYTDPVAWVYDISAEDWL